MNKFLKLQMFYIKDFIKLISLQTETNCNALEKTSILKFVQPPENRFSMLKKAFKKFPLN